MNLRHFGVCIHALHVVVVFKQIHEFMNLLQLRLAADRRHHLGQLSDLGGLHGNRLGLNHLMHSLKILGRS